VISTSLFQSLENLRPDAILSNLRNSKPGLYTEVLPASEGDSEAEIPVAKVAMLTPYGETSVGRFPSVPVLLSALHDLSLTELYYTATTGTSECVYYYGEPRVNIVKASLDREELMRR
jgi:hypothetical protein